MYGLIFGVITGLILSMTEVTSYWWVLWSALIGLLLEACTRLGCGEPLASLFECLSFLEGIDFGD